MQRKITARDNGSLVDSLRSAMRILVGSALAPAPVADRTFKPLRTHAARSATYYIWQTIHWKLKLMTTRYLNMKGMIVNGKEHNRTVFINFPRSAMSYWHVYQYKLSSTPHSYMNLKVLHFCNLEAKYLKERKVKDYEYKRAISAWSENLSQSQYGSEVCLCDMIEQQHELITI